jgi:hypothetical protein
MSWDSTIIRCTVRTVDNPYKHELLMTMLVHTNYSERSYSQNNRLVTEINIKAFTRVFDQYFKRMNPQVLVPA